jgi:hypothetical protein
MTMSEERETSEKFELAVDRAVRDLLDVEPPAGLRFRVLQRIEHDTAASVASGFAASGFVASALRRKNILFVGSAFRRKIILLPLTAAAILALALVLPWRSGPAAPAQISTANVRTVSPPVEARRHGDAAPPRQVAVRDSHSPARVGNRSTAERANRMVGAASLTPADAAEGSVEPLQPMRSIGVAAISGHTIAPAAIDVPPLTAIPEVQVAPLTPPDGRN